VAGTALLVILLLNMSLGAKPVDRVVESVMSSRGTDGRHPLSYWHL
jgi:hypothetical protein